MENNIKPDDILNWSVISKALSNHRTVIRKNSIPVKYRKKVGELQVFFEKWLNEALESRIR